MIISNLAYDLIFTVLLSVFMLNRRMLKAMRLRLILPIILCLISIYLSEHLELSSYNISRNIAGRQNYRLKERYMYLMSRFCFCFVNVASKLFLFKEAAFQKAWSIVSEESCAAEFEEEVTSFQQLNKLDLSMD